MTRPTAPTAPRALGGLPGWLLAAAGLAVLYVPTGLELARTFWATDDQGHGPVILALAGWLLWRRRRALAALSSRPAPVAGWIVLALSLAAYAVGRSQLIVQLEVGSLLGALAGLALLWRGAAGLRGIAFPLFFLLFMVPLPGVFVQTLTVPLKSAVSAVANDLLYAAGYPISRSGVVLHIGPYELLVADACAGLNSMFTLESLGLLYLNLMGYPSRLRNVLLALLVVPISFAANVVRVMVLVLVTYHFGDEAGQGFVHGAAGLLLFLVALSLLLAADHLVGRFVPSERARG